MSQNEQSRDTLKTSEPFAKHPPTTLHGYRAAHVASMKERERFWREQADRLCWSQPFETVVEEDFTEASVAWFPEGMLNGCRNVLDLNLERGYGSRQAIYSISPYGEEETVTFDELAVRVKAMAKALKAHGLKAGDRVALYCPECTEVVVIMLACARLGLTYVPIPFRFPENLAFESVEDSGASLVVLGNCGGRPMYENRARNLAGKLKELPCSLLCIGECPISENVLGYADFLRKGEGEPEPEILNVPAEHPLMLLYAKLAPGMPRGSVFATGGFLVQAATSYDHIFNGSNDRVDTIFCTVSLASAAGQSYGFWGPLLNGDCILLHSIGTTTPIAPVVDKVLRAQENCALLTTPRVLLRLRTEYETNDPDTAQRFVMVASCGNVLTPRVVNFCTGYLAETKERVINLWVQSETGTALMNTYANAELNRPGSLGLPAMGVGTKILNNAGEVCSANQSGQLVFSQSWPAMARGIWRQAERFRERYFHRFPGYYNTNDGLREDADGFHWFMGRLDDVIKVNDQSLATSEIEAVLIVHEKITEAAVVGIHEEPSDRIIVFLVPNQELIPLGNMMAESALATEIEAYLAQRLGDYAGPYKFLLVPELPRTATGKVVRRLLRRIATGDIQPAEDLSHVANPESVNNLIKSSGN